MYKSVDIHILSTEYVSQMINHTNCTYQSEAKLLVQYCCTSVQRYITSQLISVRRYKIDKCCYISVKRYVTGTVYVEGTKCLFHANWKYDFFLTLMIFDWLIQKLRSKDPRACDQWSFCGGEYNSLCISSASFQKQLGNQKILVWCG